jgi:hypothetical protein
MNTDLKSAIANLEMAISLLERDGRSRFYTGVEDIGNVYAEICDLKIIIAAAKAQGRDDGLNHGGE